jgi:hypothetical protein
LQAELELGYKNSLIEYIWLNVTIRPNYKKNLKAVYPKIASNLSHINEFIVEEVPLIFDLVGKPVKLFCTSDGNPAFKDILLKYRNKLSNLHEKIQGHISEWILPQADQVLYKIEDIFYEIELELDRL